MLNISDVRLALTDMASTPPDALPLIRRRALVRVAAVLPIWSLLPLRDAESRKKNKKRKRDRKPETNAFGCLNVGQHCSGKDSSCCSGVCDGKKPKKGKKDKSKCIAHNAGPCQDAFDVCTSVAVPCSVNDLGGCFKTTGNAPFCGVGDTPCVPCKRDVDCVDLGFGFGAACIVCNFLCAAESGGTMCVSAGV